MGQSSAFGDDIDWDFAAREKNDEEINIAENIITIIATVRLATIIKWPQGFDAEGAAASRSFTNFSI